MAVANVGSKWVEGNLVFFSKITGQEILVFDAEDEKLVIPDGSGIETDLAAITLTAPDDVTLELDKSTPAKLQVKDGGVDEDKLAASVAGDGLSGGNGDPLEVLVDAVTIEIDNTDGLQTKGVSGSFEDGDGKTITVTKGIITSLGGEG